MRNFAPQLLGPLGDDDERAEMELTLQEHVLQLKSFAASDERMMHSAHIRMTEYERANQLVKTLVASGLLRNRGNVRRALFLGIEAALPHWTNLCQC